jgi:uncharacterized protein (TIGR00725 family)
MRRCCATPSGSAACSAPPERCSSAANVHVDVAIATGLGELRNGLVVRCADVVIAVGGEFGTLSEIGFALRLGVPVVGLGTWGLVRSDGRADESIARARDADHAVELALARLA